jgi:hypothetical protein
MQGQFHFVDGTAIHIGSQIPDIPKDVQIGECLACIKENSIVITECMLQLIVLGFDVLCMIYIQRGTIFFRDGDKFVVG